MFPRKRNAWHENIPNRGLATVAPEGLCGELASSGSTNPQLRGLYRMKVLFVDDESNVLEGYERSLRKRYSIDAALGGELGLKLLDQHGPYAVIVADMQMPAM